MKNNSTTKKLDQVFEDYSVTAVPKEKTKGWLSMGLIWSGVGISLGLLLTGGTLGDGMSIKQIFFAALIAGLLLALITALIGIIGAKTGFSTAMVSRFTFGNTAIILVAFIQAMGSYGWFAVQLGLFGRTTKTAWEMGTGLPGNENLFIIIGGLCMIATATLGYKGLDFLSKLAVPLLLILMGVSLWMILQDFSISEILNFGGNENPITFGTGVSLAVSSFVVGAVVAPDVSRYAKTPKHTIGGAVLAFLIVVPMVLMVGSTMAQATGTWDIVDIMIRLGWGIIAFIVLMLAQWTSNDNNLYCGALGFTVAFKKLKKWHITLAAGFIGIVLALLGIYDNFEKFLNVLGVFIPPMAGVIAVDYFLFKSKQYTESNLTSLVSVRWFALSAWIVGSTISFISTYLDIDFTTMPAFDGLIISAIIHFILMKFVKNEKITNEARENISA